MDSRVLIKRYLSNEISYEKYSGYIVFPTTDLNMRVIAEVRGRGSLDALIQDIYGVVTPYRVEELKSELGNFIVEAIKEKVKRDFPNNEPNDISPNQQKLF